METSNFTIESVNAMSSTDLRKAASALGIKSYAKYTKVELLALVIAALPTPTPAVSAKTPRAVARIEITPEMQAVLDSPAKKADKFRSLSQLGMPTVQIADVTGSYYSFVHGSLKRKVEAPAAEVAE